MIWDDGVSPEPVRMTPAAVMRVLLRGVPMALVVFGELLLLLLVRLVERPVYGLDRPLRPPHITVFVCRTALRILGLDLNVQGQPMTQHGAVVANHSSWLDIFVLNASKRIYFVSKSEVAGWPGIGWLARATGTVFIERNPARAREQTRLFQDRLLAGHKLLFFPEGTSTDGEEFFLSKQPSLRRSWCQIYGMYISVQPVSVAYHAPRGASERFYGWWGGYVVRPTSSCNVGRAAPRGGRCGVPHAATRCRFS